MNLNWIDWTILAALFVVLNVSGFLCRRHIRGVADFLVAGRGVGRYLGVGAASMTGVGAVTILAMWQLNYKAGFVGQWWLMLTPAAGIIVADFAHAGSEGWLPSHVGDLTANMAQGTAIAPQLILLLQLYRIA